MYTMYNETGYLLKEGNVVTSATYEKYFETFVKEYAGNKEAEFRKVEWDTRLDQFVLEYALPADWCSTCDEAEVTEGICEGHGEPWVQFIDYKIVDLYAHA